MTQPISYETTIKGNRNNRRLSKCFINSSKKENFKKSERKVYRNKGLFRVYKKNTRKYVKEYYRNQKKRDNDRYVTESSNKTKAMWQLINRELAKMKKLEKKIGNNIISNPTENAEKLNTYFTNTVAELVQ